jgi:hypothetical protein
MVKGEEAAFNLDAASSPYPDFLKLSSPAANVARRENSGY